MKPLPTLIAILCLTGLAVAWHVSTRPEQLPPPSFATTPDQPPPVTPDAPPIQTPIARLDAPGRGATVSPDAADLANASSPNGIETEMVLGIEVRKDRDCTVEIRYVVDPRTSEAAEVYICTPNTPTNEDPYESWDAETLAAMAYGDAHAAEVLGLRHLSLAEPIQEELGLALIYRSVAMSGDFETFRKAMAKRYPYTSVNGEPQIEILKQSAVFATIASKLGNNSLNPDFYYRHLKQANVSDSEIADLNNQITSIMRVMAAIQTETTGDSTIMEAIENA